MNVNVYHNVTVDPVGRPLGMLDGYREGHRLVLVTQFEMDGGAVDNSTLEEVFRLLNVGDDPEFGTPDPRAVAYRAAGNRSLSVGDVVQVDGEWFAVDRFGWTPIKKPTVEEARREGD